MMNAAAPTVVCRHCGFGDPRDGTVCRRCHRPNGYVPVLVPVVPGSPELEPARFHAGPMTPAAQVAAVCNLRETHVPVIPAGTPSGTPPTAPGEAPSRAFAPKARPVAPPKAVALQGVAWEAVDGTEPARLLTGLREADLTLGGNVTYGMARGRAYILDGAPGAGKSTWVLMALAGLAQHGPAVYACGEEDKEAIKARAARLGLVMPPNVWIVEGRDIRPVLAQVAAIGAVALALDSISVYADPDQPGEAGALRQLKHCTLAVIAATRRHAVVTMAISHQTKDGDANVPNAIKHEYDAHVQMDLIDPDDKKNPYRRMSVRKNRGGCVHRTAYYEMRALDGRLVAVSEATAMPPREGP